MHAAEGLEARLARLEASGEIRAVLTRYMEICDDLGPDTPMDELGDLFTETAVWRGKGARYASAFGEHRGRDAILDMLGRYRGPPPHFALNAHFLGSERLDVADAAARGRWMMLQTSSYGDGRSEVRAARLTIAFTLSGGRWRIAQFETENIFAKRLVSLDDAAATPTPSTDP